MTPLVKQKLHIFHIVDIGMYMFFVANYISGKVRSLFAILGFNLCIHPFVQICFDTFNFHCVHVCPQHRWTLVWGWTAVTCLTLWRTWSGSVTACRHLKTSWCTAAALTLTLKLPTPFSWSVAPPSTSSTCSCPASSSRSWPHWASTCRPTQGRRFPLGSRCCWRSLCSSCWWLRACLLQKACLT